MSLTRRELITALAGTMLPMQASCSEPSLRTKAKNKGITYGSAVQATALSNPVYANFVTSQCGIITPENDAKWGPTEWDEGVFTLGRLDTLADFAKRHNIALHMTSFVWALGIPPWVQSALIEGRGREVLSRHIKEIAGRYAGRVDSWDVTNESVNQRGWPDELGLLMSPWRKYLGPDFISEALHYTRSADPSALLLINEAGLEYQTEESEWKRRKVLKLVEYLKARNAPLDGVGLESHLATNILLAGASYRGFLTELASMGVSIYITELDVDDQSASGDIESRDRAVADLTRRFLDMALDERAVKKVITWGLSDPYSYLNQQATPHRSDGLPSRPLPFDAELQPKPMWHAIASAFDHAPVRS